MQFNEFGTTARGKQPHICSTALPVLSNVVFLQAAQLQSAKESIYQARLDIQPETPDDADKGTVGWSVVAAIYIARARDINKKKKVRVTMV